MSPIPNTSEPPFDPALVLARERDLPWLALEQVTHLDPAGRGLASFRRAGAALDAGQLREAAIHLACYASSVLIVTGFCVVTPDGVTAETDGPPGALFLARSLAAAGARVTLASDAYGVPLLAAGCELWRLDGVSLVEFPIDPVLAQSAIEQWFSDGTGARCTHVVSIERPGPSHTRSSLERQTPGPSRAIEQFLASVPESSRNHAHNMHGELIDRYTSPLHSIFDRIGERQLPITTIGIGDGGNEIGMGTFDWQTLVAAIPSAVAPRIASRVTTDYTLIGGTSDWAAYALALTFARLRDVADRGGRWDAASQEALVRELVRAGAVDGISRRREATVDGLPLDTYLRPLAEIRRLLGLPVD